MNTCIIDSISKTGKSKIKCSKCSKKGSGILKIEPELIKILLKLFEKTGSGFVNSVINKLPFELHLPGHNFTGPGTQLLWGKTRLNPDYSYKGWSKPINRVDEAAYNHDVCYLMNKDTETRNKVCDKNMLNELDDIENPTFREKAERLVVKPIIWSKKQFGMGLFDFMKDIEKYGLHKSFKIISPYINNKMKIYCLRCKTETDTKNYQNETMKTKKGPKLRGKGICVKCGAKKSVFLKQMKKI